MRVLTGSQGPEAIRAILSPTALRIVGLLSKGAMAAEQLSAEVGNPPSTVYRELEKLMKVGVIKRSMKPELAVTGRPHHQYALAIEGVDTESFTVVLSHRYLLKLSPFGGWSEGIIPPPPDAYRGPQAKRIIKFFMNNLNRRILQELAHAPLYARAIAEHLGVHESVIVRRLHQLKEFGFIEPVAGLSKRGKPAKYYTLKGGMGAKLIIIPAGIGPFKELTLIVKKPKKSLFPWRQNP